MYVVLESGGIDQNLPKPKRPMSMSKTAHVISPKRPLLVCAVLLMAVRRSVLGLGRFGLMYGPFWTCQKFVGHFGLGRFSIDRSPALQLRWTCHIFHESVSDSEPLDSDLATCDLEVTVPY